VPKVDERSDLLDTNEAEDFTNGKSQGLPEGESTNEREQDITDIQDIEERR